MQSFAGLIAAAGLLLLAADKADDANKADLDKLQGTWKLQSAQVAGKDYGGKADLVAQTITFANDQATCKDIPGDKATAKVDATKTPATLTFTDKNGKVVRLAAYQFDGDDLKWAFLDLRAYPPGKDLPADLFSKPGVDYMVLTYKRDKK
jgi:uncharacterized protein (TIGR03067 family)